MPCRHCTETLSATLLLSRSSSPRARRRTIATFSTDGCSLFPDHSLISKADWCQCCVAHDLAYWRGGTAERELKADRSSARACGESRAQALADLMYAGVRTGGGPHFYTPYRWGYGWPFGRPIGNSPEEEAKASR